MLSEQFKPLFIDAVANIPVDVNFRQNAVWNVLLEMCKEIDEYMDFGAYRHSDDEDDPNEPEICSFFAYFNDRSTAIMQVRFTDGVTAEVIALPPTDRKTTAELFVEEFRNSQDPTPDTLDRLLMKYRHFPNMANNIGHIFSEDFEINWRNPETDNYFAVFSDGSIAACEKYDIYAYAHNYLK